jgi:hypothetical protein
VKISELRTWKLGGWVIFLLGSWLLFITVLGGIFSLATGFSSPGSPLRLLIAFLMGAIMLVCGTEVLRQRAAGTIPYAAGAVLAASLGVGVDLYHKRSFQLDGDFGPYALVIVAAAALLAIGNQVYRAERDPSGNDAFQRFMKKLLPP